MQLQQQGFSRTPRMPLQKNKGHASLRKACPLRNVIKESAPLIRPHRRDERGTEGEDRWTGRSEDPVRAYSPRGPRPTASLTAAGQSIVTPRHGKAYSGRCGAPHSARLSRTALHRVRPKKHHYTITLNDAVPFSVTCRSAKANRGKRNGVRFGISPSGSAPPQHRPADRRKPPVYPAARTPPVGLATGCQHYRLPALKFP